MTTYNSRATKYKIVYPKLIILLAPHCRKCMPFQLIEDNPNLPIIMRDMDGTDMRGMRQI